MIYNKYNEKKEWSGCTTRPNGFFTEKPIKPLSLKDKAFFIDGDWKYEYEELQEAKEETEMLFSNWFPATFYNEEIYPENGNIILDKSQDISILIPCYNKSEYITECVKSCINQTLKPKEIVVLAMDKDSQSLKLILEDLSDNVKVICSERMNVCKARTTLVNGLCSTDWFVFCDADDLLEEHCLEYLYKEEASVVFPSIYMIKEFGQPKYDDNLPNAVVPYKNGHHSACMNLNMTALMNKQIFNEVGLDEDLCDGGEDFDFNVRLLAMKKYKVSCIWSTWYYYRVTDGLSKKTAFFRSHFKAVKKNLDFLHNEYVKIKGYHDCEDRFYHNPSLLNLRRHTDYTWLVAEKRDMLEAKRIASRRKEPLCAYSPEQFIGVGIDFIDGLLVLGKTFDVMFLEKPTIKCFKEDIPMIINKDVWSKARLLTGWQRVIFLLENYACFDTDWTSFSTDWEECFEIIKNSKEQTKTLQEQLKLLSAETVEFKKKGDIDITFTLHKGCNASCEYCNQGTSHKNSLSDEEMFANFDKAISIAEKKVGKFIPSIIGGEPTLWKDDFVKKILERLKDYPLIKLYTNGFNKNSLWYKTDKVIIKRHVIDWVGKPELFYRENLQKNEIPVIVVTKKDIKDLEQVVSDPRVTVLVSPCLYSKQIDLDLDSKDFEYLKELGNKYKFMTNTDCLKGNSKEIDCEKMTGMWCCQIGVGVPLEEMKEDISMCKNCNCYKEGL